MIGEHELEAMRALADDGERARFFARHPELRTGASVEALCTEVARWVGVDLEPVAALARTAVWLADSVGDPRARAFAARAQANALHFLGESALAQTRYGEALAGFEQLGERVEAAIVRSNALLNLAYLGEYERVWEWYRAARVAFETAGDRARQAVLEHNLANVLYRQDRWAEALERYRAAFEVFAALERAQEAAICLHNLAVCQISLHHFEAALATYEEGRAYALAHGLERVVSQIDYNIAYLFYLRGEYTRAIQLFRAARKRCATTGDDYHHALCDLDQAEIYLELNLVEEAAALAGSALAGFERLEMPYEAAKASTYLAIALGRQGKTEPAVESLARARAIFVRERNPMWTALTDVYQAVVLHHARRPQAALALECEARAAFLDAALAPRAALCDVLHAELLLELGDAAHARAACHEALRALSGLALPALEQQAWLVLGHAEEAVGERAAALAAYQQAHQRLERLRTQLHGEDFKIAFLKDRQGVYEGLFWLTLQEPPSIERDVVAFLYCEQAKSRSLADLLAFGAHALPVRAPEHAEAAARVKALRQELCCLYRELDRQPLASGEGGRALGDSTDANLRQSARSKENELLAALRDLRAGDPELGALQTGASVDLEELRATLAPGTVLLEYYLAREMVFATVLDRGRLEVVALGSAKRARAAHRLLQLQLSKLALGPPPPPELRPLAEEATRAHLGELFDLLVAPLRGRIEAEHLIVVPHGFLHYIPFHALWDGERHLLDHSSISYAPSAEVFRLCARKPAAATRGSLVLGVSDERAPEILEEVAVVASALPGARRLVGTAATADALRHHGPGCRYLHLATHGLYRRDNPMFSAIQLGDSRLSLFDLYDLRLDAELVVLSGCGTGLSAVVGADELVGLTRGLLFAGARAVLVTLWDVHDQSTAHFMARFYHHLATGLGHARALGAAMGDVRCERPHPYYWAPFVLVGKPGASGGEMLFSHQNPIFS